MSARTNRPALKGPEKRWSFRRPARLYHGKGDKSEICGPRPEKKVFFVLGGATGKRFLSTPKSGKIPFRGGKTKDDWRVLLKNYRMPSFRWGA